MKKEEIEKKIQAEIKEIKWRIEYRVTVLYPVTYLRDKVKILEWVLGLFEGE